MDCGHKVVDLESNITKRSTEQSLPFKAPSHVANERKRPASAMVGKQRRERMNESGDCFEEMCVAVSRDRAGPRGT